MSSTSSRAPPQPAPWKRQFLEHMNKMPSPEFVLSTLAAAPPDSISPYLPRARYCIFRGLWAELPENEHNKAPRNPRAYESELPTFTTDVRMEKVGHLFGSGADRDEKDHQGSGGGAPVEAVWLVKVGNTMTQWRVKGTAFVVAPDIDSATHSGVRTVKTGIGSRMRVVDGAKTDEWTWKREMDGHFGNLSPGMRGTFKQPPSGMPVSVNPDPDNLKMGQDVNDLNDPVARKNFRVVIIKPDLVESLDLSNPVTARRQRYEYDESSGKWKHEEAWP